jgi:hypothetical protein
VRFSRVGVGCLALAFSASCVKNSVPYGFRSPVVGGVSAPELDLDSAERWSQTPSPSQKSQPASRRQSARARRATTPPAPLVRETTVAAPLPAARGEELALHLRGLVGRREPARNHVEFVLDALRSMGATLGALEDAADGKQLMARASQHDAAVVDYKPRLGDLVVFDEVERHQAASLSGVVVSVDNQGTVEFVYLARGVVRRGFVNPAHKGRKRDDAGRVLNTFIRHSDGKDPWGTRYLASQLLSSFVRLDRLGAGREVARR